MARLGSKSWQPIRNTCQVVASGRPRSDRVTALVGHVDGGVLGCRGERVLVGRAGGAGPDRCGDGDVHGAAGVIAVIWVSELTVNEAAGIPPNETAVAPVNPVPVIVTLCPPARGPA